jgi:peptidoglycan hydrolase-like protein with peptidoglycan-binding domain
MARRGLRSSARLCVALAALLGLIVPATAEASYASRTLQSGSHGSDVKQLQTYLTRAGIPTTADGHYGSGTVSAVKRFERQAGWTPDGKATPSEQRVIRTAATSTGGSSAGGGSGGGGGGSQGGGSSRSGGNRTGRARLSANGRTAIAPNGAPQQVKDAIAAANRITRKPYRYGGGHGRWNDSGYDCSGSVSYALHGGHLLSSPLPSGPFMSWGRPGAGRWITVYANSGHAYAVIAGLRFDTSSAGAGGGSGPRWRTRARSSSGYVARHPAGF